MARNEDFKLLRIQTVVLKVNIHCDGCRHKVRKLLLKVEGVYTVNVNVDERKVTVTGNVDAEILINRLARSGKHASLWCFQQKPNTQQQQKSNANAKDHNNKSKKTQQQPQQQDILKAIQQRLNNQHHIRFNTEEDEEGSSGGGGGEFDDLTLITNKINQVNLLKNQNSDNGGGAQVKKCPGVADQMGFRYGENSKVNDTNVAMIQQQQAISHQHQHHQRAPQIPPCTAGYYSYQHSNQFNDPYFNNPLYYYNADEKNTHGCSVM